MQKNAILQIRATVRQKKMNYLTFVKNWGKSDKMLKKCKSIGGIFMRKGTKKFFAMALAVTVALGTLT